MYTVRDFKTKKELKVAVVAFLEGQGPEITFYQPGGLFPEEIGSDNRIFLEGPHYPKPHTWYAQAWVDPETKRHIVKVK